MPGRDEVGRVGSQLGDVDEVHGRRSVTQRVVQQVDVVGDERCHDRLARGQTVEDEGHGLREELRVTPEEEGLVPVPDQRVDAWHGRRRRRGEGRARAAGARDGAGFQVWVDGPRWRERLPP